MICISEDESCFAWKRKIKIISFWIAEIFFAGIWVIFSTKIKTFEWIKEITIKDLGQLLFLLFFFVFND